MSISEEMRKYSKIINEARIIGDPDISYTMGAKTKKAEVSGDFDSVTAKLSGMKEKIPNKFAAESLQLKTQIEELESKRADIHKMMGEGANALFDAEDAILTRYIETSKAIVTLTKETQDVTSQEEEIDYPAVLQEIYKLVSKKLIPEIELAIKNNTKIINKVKKGSASRVMVRGKDQTIESLNESDEEIANWAMGYKNKVDARMSQYDEDLAQILSKVR